MATTWWEAIQAGIVYGFPNFCIFIGGKTLTLGLPYATSFVIITLIWGRKKLAQQPVPAFFFIACLFAFLLFAGGGLYWGGFPQFSDVGLTWVVHTAF